MDQLKVYWAVVVKYHFWILMVIVLIVSLTSFYMTRQSIDQQVVTRVGAVEGKFRNVSTLAAEATTHPNSLSDKEMNESIKLMTNDVKLAWESQYNRQRGILVWPEDVGTTETLKKLNSYRPIEFFLEYSNPPKPDPLSLTEREVYRDYVKDVFPKLAKIVGASWTAVMSSASSFGPPSGSSSPFNPGSGQPSPSGNPVNEVAPLVLWDTGSQSTLQKEIIPWFDPLSPPSTLEICYTQEDLWVLDGVLRVIKRTNGNARENFQAPIKEIEWIRLGKAARADAGNVFGTAALNAVTGPQGASGFPGAVPQGEQQSGGSPYGPGFGSGRSAVRSDPADGRYVESDYKPISGSQLRTSMKSSSPKDAQYAVAKRIPVQFRLKMDPTKIATLITECGNNSLLIEVKQVRVNGEDTKSGGGGGMGSMGPGAGPPLSEGASSAGRMSYGAGTEVAKGGDVPVEIFGIVYLFNPVDIQKLGLDKVTVDTTLDGAADDSSPPGVGIDPSVAAPGNKQQIGNPAIGGQGNASPVVQPDPLSATGPPEDS